MDNLSISCSTHVNDMRSTKIDMYSTKMDIRSTYHRQKTTKTMKFMSTSYRHRFLCRYDVDIKIHDFCHFLSMACWSDVHFGQVHVEFMSTASDDMYRLHIDTDFCVDMMSTKKSTKCRQKSRKSLPKSTKIGRHHVDKRHQNDTRGAGNMCLF